jgi:hypothetical protein
MSATLAPPNQLALVVLIRRVVELRKSPGPSCPFLAACQPIAKGSQAMAQRLHAYLFIRFEE